MKPLGLGPPDLRGSVLDPLQLQEELVEMLVRPTAVLAPVVAQDGPNLEVMLLGELDLAPEAGLATLPFEGNRSGDYRSTPNGYTSSPTLIHLIATGTAAVRSSRSARLIYLDSSSVTSLTADGCSSPLRRNGRIITSSSW